MAMSSGGSQGPITGINITPLVDVCLVLVIIFMVTAPLMTQNPLPVELPKATTAQGKETDNVTITITLDGRWALNNQPLAPADLERVLADKLARSRDRYVIVRADRSVRYEQVLLAMRAARSSGAKDFAIATEQKTNGEGGR